MLAEIFLLRLETLARFSKDTVTTTSRFVPFSSIGPVVKSTNRSNAPER
jgi:hypothetical protein